MHGVALPDGDVARGLYGFDVFGEFLRDEGGAIAGYESDFANGFGRVDDVEELGELGAGYGGPDFDPDRVLDPAEVLDVRAAELPRAVADPQEVRRGVEVFWDGV